MYICVGFWVMPGLVVVTTGPLCLVCCACTRHVINELADEPTAVSNVQVLGLTVCPPGHEGEQGSLFNCNNMTR